MKKFLKVAGLLLLVGTGIAIAREIRTPLPTIFGFMRYPVEYGWEDQCDRDDDCWCWNFEASGVGYCRTADQAFSTCIGRCKVPFVNLLFGASDFRLEQAFYGADVGTAIPTNPWVSISTISPRYDYDERGGIFGAHLSTRFDCCDYGCRAGMRVKLPYRDIQVTDVCGLSNLIGETLNDVYRERMEENSFGGGGENTVIAARLDFLSCLKRLSLTGTGLTQDLVNYKDSASSESITIAGQAIDSAVKDGEPLAAAIYSADGTMPLEPRWGTPSGAAYITGTIAANGSGLSDNQRGRFVDTTDYSTTLKDDTVAQSKLFIVPTLKNNGTLAGLTTQAIQTAIAQAVSTIDENVLDFTNEKGLNFCDGRTKGLGDLTLELYLGTNFACDDRAWADLSLFFSFPTADELCNCLEVLKQPLGNNEHFEIGVGLAGGYDLWDWCKIMADFHWVKALSHCERVAAPFQGATIKNIGPCINADIDWWFFIGHLDLSFFASDCCGFDIGWEPYYKSCDNICLCARTATDWTDTVRNLDASVLAKDTKRVAHKLRASFFTIIGDCEILAGWDQVIAGKNIPRETDWYISFDVTF